MNDLLDYTVVASHSANSSNMASPGPEELSDPRNIVSGKSLHSNHSFQTRAAHEKAQRLRKFSHISWSYNSQGSRLPPIEEDGNSNHEQSERFDASSPPALEQHLDVPEGQSFADYRCPEGFDRGPGLIENQSFCRRALDVYNYGASRHWDDAWLRSSLLSYLLRRDVSRDKISISPPFSCRYGYNIQFGQNITIKDGCSIQDDNIVHIGSNCHLDHHVSISTQRPMLRHPGGRPTVGFQGLLTDRPVIIRDGCRIENNVTILSGVTIGKDCWIEAGAVISANIDIPELSHVEAGMVVRTATIPLLKFV